MLLPTDGQNLREIVYLVKNDKETNNPYTHTSIKNTKLVGTWKT